MSVRWRAARCDAAFAVLLLALGALGARHYLLIRDHRHERIALAERQQRRVYPVPARRGSLYARSASGSVPVAISHQEPYCFIDPYLLRPKELSDTALEVSRIVGVEFSELQDRLFLRPDARFVKIDRPLTPEQVRAIEDLNLQAVGVIYDWRRRYPNDSLAAPVVGFCRVDGVASGGAELALDEQLSAEDGRRVVLADAARRSLYPLEAESRLPRDGRNVYLTLDANIQEFLEEAVAEALANHGGAETWATGVVADPYTGDILAMVSLPAFNPNEYGRATDETRTNRAISLPYEPGSVVKPLFAAAAVDAGALHWTSKIDCEDGRYRAHKGGWISDHGHAFGHLTLEDILIRSSNIGMAKVGEKLGNPALHEIARRFGFGQASGIDLPAESPGQLRPLYSPGSSGRRRMLWDGYSLRRVPFGQEISTTSLQLTMAFCSLANGGLLLEPRMVERVTDADHETLWRREPKVVRRVLRPSTARQAVAVMRRVVEDEHGTGNKCRLEHWTSFGKTGTAQVVGQDADGKFRYLDGKYTGSFIGGAPASRPRVICLISVYCPDRSKGYYGGTVAAPYVKKVLEQTMAYMNVPPDKHAGRLATTRR